MFCRNCGKEIANNAAVCVSCGVASGQGARYCPNCGSETVPNAAVCTRCGVALAQQGGGQKSKLAAGLLGIFLGGFGVHNFYLGYIGKAVGQLILNILGILLAVFVVGFFLSAAAGIWGLVEGIMILTGSISKDAKGIPLKE